MTKKKKVNPKVGDVFTFPIDEHSFCFGQVITANSASFTKLYILFDFVSDVMTDIQTVIRKPILAIAHLDDGCILDGIWKIIGNTEVALKNIKYPNYLMGLPQVVISYDGRELRQATEQDILELDYPSSYTSHIFVDLARAKYANQEWADVYDEILFDKDKWVETSQNRSNSFYQVNLDDTKVDDHEDDMVEVTIQYKIDTGGFGTPEDLVRRYKIEEVLDSCLRKTGYGDCGGAEIGSGEMLIFCFVKNPEKAAKIIKQELEKHGLLDGANITY